MIPSTVLSKSEQSVSDALAIWEQAAKENRPVGLDKNHNLTLLYGAHSDNFRSPHSQLASAKAVVLSKMHAEASQGGSWNASMMRHIMETRMPSLALFLSADQIGALRQEWEIFQAETFASLRLPPAVLAQRKAVAERISPFLPAGLGISLHDNGQSWLTHTFSDQEQQRILSSLASLATEPLDAELHIDRQTLKDLNRAKYSIKLPQGAPLPPPSTESIKFLHALDERKNLRAQEKDLIRQLHTFCNGNLLMMGTLSTLMNQYAVSALIKADENELLSPSGEKIIFHSNNKTNNTLSSFVLQRKDEGDILLQISFMRKGDLLTDPSGQPLCPLKSGPATTPCSDDHFNFRCTTAILLDPQNLERGQILPRTSLMATASYVIDVRW